MNAKAIRQYCGKCSDANNKPVAENDRKSDRYDLVDFDF